MFRSTYRLQLGPELTFDDAAALAGYLRDLGVSHLYSSPILQAAPGSTHGYDVIDHSRLSQELGGAAGHDRLCQALREHGLSQILDVVPNHMALAGRANPWWWDVLENGPSSPYAAYFDVDWEPPEAKLRHRVLIPVLGDHYGRVLEAGELELAREGGSFLVRYHEHEAPVSPRSLDGLLERAAEACGSDELASIAVALGRLPHASATDRASIVERHRDKEVLRSRLEQLCEQDAEMAAAIDREVARFNRDPDALDGLLSRQNYRLAYWRTAGQELDYRRFFDITTLVALTAENPEVFAETHRLVLEMVRDGRVEGLRVDHPDGLRDPLGYLERLHQETARASVWVEKILESDERLPDSWPVAGTTGYEFLNRVAGLFVDPAGEDALSTIYEDFTGETADFAAVAWQAKCEITERVLAADVERLTSLFVDVCESHRRYRDYTRMDLRDALRGALAGMGVYRTYVRPGKVSDDDRSRITAALDAARSRRPDLEAELMSFLGEVLVLQHDGEAERELALRFQQVSAAVTAKGVEDTAFYRHCRLVSLNEVGGDPGRFGRSVEEFHAANAEAQARWPLTLLATTTHDTKRSEDVRARISLLSEMPQEWSSAVARWSAANQEHWRDGGPDRNAEYLLYQTLVGAFPLDVDRAVAYMEKATKEAKVHTSWVDPDPAYDAALKGFVEGVLADEPFLSDLAGFVAPLVEAGQTTSLAQTLLKLTSPGVPDIYQGTELWDLSLVDPDNRRPVDFEERRALLATSESPKQSLIARVLAFRRQQPELFGPGATYEPLAASGERADHLVAFVRSDAAVTVIPRLVLGLGSDWRDTTLTLPPGIWSDVLSKAEHGGGPVPLAELLARLPVALLARTA